jgi:DNA-binding XRE family transcriptional regulator
MKIEHLFIFGVPSWRFVKHHGSFRGASLRMNNHICSKPVAEGQPLRDRHGKPLSPHLQAALEDGKHPLKIWRRERGWSMGQLGRMANVTTKTIFHIEKFNVGPEEDVLHRLAEVLNVCPDLITSAD